MFFRIFLGLHAVAYYLTRLRATVLAVDAPSDNAGTARDSSGDAFLDTSSLDRIATGKRSSHSNRNAARGSCRILWPRLGDAYPRSRPVYAHYACRLGDDRPGGEIDGVGASYGNISARVDFACMDDNNGSETPIGTVVYPYTHQISNHSSISDEFAFAIQSECTVVRLLFSISQDSEVIDTQEVVIFSLPDTYFEASAVPSHNTRRGRCVFNATSQSCEGGGEGTLSPRYYDFVEIGTSGYDTLIEAASDWHVGLSVEVMKDLQDTLPDRAGVTKVNAAIGDEAGWSDIYFYPKSILEYFGHTLTSSDKMSQDMHGLGRLGAPNPVLVSRMRSNGAWDFNPIFMRRKVVRVQPVGQLLAENGASAIGFLKIDAEGSDCKILTATLKYLKQNSGNVRYPRLIEFEASFDIDGSIAIIEQLRSIGYNVYRITYGTQSPEHSKYNTGMLAVVYAELSEKSDLFWDQIYGSGISVSESSGVKLDRVSSRLSGIVSSHFFAFRELCADFNRDNPVNVSESDPQGSNTIYCSIITSGLSHDVDLRILGISNEMERT